MKKIEAFETSDGKIFKTQEEAKQYEARLKLKKLIESNGGYSEHVDAIQLFIDENMDQLASIFKDLV